MVIDTFLTQKLYNIINEINFNILNKRIEFHKKETGALGSILV